MKRRFFLFAAPAIVAAPSLMRVSTLPAELLEPVKCWLYTKRTDPFGTGFPFHEQGLIAARASELAQIERDLGLSFWHPAPRRIQHNT